MKRLFLLRHAKSSWHDPSLPDIQRPLNARGRAAAPEIGRYISRRSYAPALILCSTAQRTVDTLDLVAPFLPRKTAIVYEAGLYLAEASELLTRVQWIDEEAQSAMIIGHNPGMHDFALMLCGLGDDRPPPSAAARRLIEKFPTAGLAVIDFEVPSWRKVKAGGGTLSDYVRPKDL
ncbi:MAG: histidine phosphatase family protein [Alphaproteobacteria bacterium]|nr:histidine phosphatase family protein [Alphaproteobacteria bacterium]